MFLALKEMKHEKLRYGLVIAVIALISYLIFILSALAMGLANENTAAVNSWNVNEVAMSKDANGNMGQSLLTQDQINKYDTKKNRAQVGITPTIIKRNGNRDSAQFVGIKKSEYIYQNLKLTQGSKPKTSDEILVSDQLNAKKYPIDGKIKLGQSNKKYKIVGYVNNGFYNMAPVIYGKASEFANVKGTTSQFAGSGVVSKTKLANKKDNTKVFTHKEFVNKMPGYSAQNSTFVFMIGFLIVISLIVVTIFLYILTVQKVPNLAVLRAQGIPNSYLTLNTFSETVMIMLSSVAVGLILLILTTFVIPTAVPMYFSVPLISAAAAGILITGMIGSLVPIRIISKIDPVTVIGG